jgi:leucyl/phenylalanyl-tRNA--protein transferase
VPVVLRPDRPGLPPAETADRHGLVALGGDLSTERLLLAYRTGIFPWYSEGSPIQWHSPPERYVLRTDRLHIGRSLRKRLNKRPYQLTMDTAFDAVIEACATIHRPGQWGTWITDEMIEAYRRLHKEGWAHSVEAWSGSRLVGGLYGVSVGAVFCGESVFALAPDASKIAFVRAVGQMRTWGTRLIDAQVHTEHLERFGAEAWSRSQFLAELARLRDAPGPPVGRWRFDPLDEPADEDAGQ